MTISQRVLKWSLFAGAIYFLLVSIVHLLGYKAPVLFIYFNVPSYTYQDRIISFLAFGWAVFFFTAFTNPQSQSALVKAILVAGAGALIGLSNDNLVSNFLTMDASINTNIFWLETAGLFLYWLWLVVFYLRAK